MTVVELSAKLVQEGIPMNAYCLTGGFPNECLCMAKEEEWEVYYSERGLKTQLQRFEAEGAACRYMYNELMEDKRRNHGDG